MAKRCNNCLAKSQAYKKLCQMVTDHTQAHVEELRDLNLELAVHRLIMNEQGEKENGLRHVGN